ncbi:MAG TPA: hypothetical protein VKU02_15880 [Gemmataceae bacterium]|nr:hypothetical protein [Gemmataceae bacterium]
MNRSHRLYVGTIGEGLWRSTDDGETFVRAADGMFVECHVRALAVHPRDPRILYLGSELGLFRTTDGADHWTRVESPLNGQQIWALCLLPQTPEVILVGTCPSRLFRSADGGRTWAEPAVDIRQACPRIMHTRVTTLLTDPNEPETVWAGVEIDGLLRSCDSGQTWQKVGSGLSSLDIHALAIIQADSREKRLLASTNNDVNLSTDEGETWQPLQLGKRLPWSYFRGMAQLPNRPGVVLLGNGDGPPGSVGTVARSSDAGANWHVATLPGQANSTIWNFAVHPADPERVYASSVSGEIYRSTDAGSSWAKLPREFGEIRALAWTP